MSSTIKREIFESVSSASPSVAELIVNFSIWFQKNPSSPYSRGIISLVSRYGAEVVSKHESELKIAFATLQSEAVYVKEEEKAKPVKKMVEVDGEFLEEVFESAYDNNTTTDENGAKVKAPRKPVVPVQMLLSPDLAAFTGKLSMIRGDVTKFVWAYVKEHGLQDPADGRLVRCDEKLQSLFKVGEITMFQITGALATHMRSSSSNDLDGSKKRAREAAKTARDEAIIAAGGDPKAKKPKPNKEVDAKTAGGAGSSSSSSSSSNGGRKAKGKDKDKDKDGAKKKTKVAKADKPKRVASANSALNQVQKLSAPLAALLKTDKARRCDVTSLIWKYIKERNLQHVPDKRIILCDEKLMSVFGAQMAEEPPECVHLHLPPAPAPAPAPAPELELELELETAAGNDSAAVAEGMLEAAARPSFPLPPPLHSFHMLKLAKFLKSHLVRSDDPEDQPLPKDETPLTVSQLTKLQADVSRFSGTQFATHRAALTAIKRRDPNYAEDKDMPLEAFGVKTLRDMEAHVIIIKQGFKDQKEAAAIRKKEGAEAIASHVSKSLAEQYQTHSFTVKVEKPAVAVKAEPITSASASAKIAGGSSSSSKINMAAMKAEPWNANTPTQPEEEEEEEEEEEDDLQDTDEDEDKDEEEEEEEEEDEEEDVEEEEFVFESGTLRDNED